MLSLHIETNASWILLYYVWTAAWQPWQTCSDKANDSGDRQSQITALQVGWWKVNATFHPVTNGLMPFESCQLEFGMVENGIYHWICSIFYGFLFNWIKGMMRKWDLIVGPGLWRCVSEVGSGDLESTSWWKVNLKMHQDKQNFKIH